MIDRTCDGCTECCQGWLTGAANGHDFYPGKPCFYITATACSIYENRPADPCKSFKCTWIEEELLPMWMRPDLCGVLTTKQTQNNVTYYQARECGKTIDSKVLSWFVMWALNSKVNLMYQVDQGWNRIGSPEFLALTL